VSKETCEAIVVGAGIVGAACADELARRGLQVVVVDRDMVGGGATAAGWDTSSSWTIQTPSLR
jgi:glycine/D-amino acid oxidase-like deaminating enzyme